MFIEAKPEKIIIDGQEINSIAWSCIYNFKCEDNEECEHCLECPIWIHDNLER